ncbi:MAG: ERCC4 domain-containing protein [Candidatus Bathyarchaeia archaeon]|jgi:ERCC4-type nuclease
MSKYTVIKDTREQDGWFFSSYDKCEGMEIGTLHTGDYTLKGYEDIVCVERKASVSEIAMNLGRKKKPFQEEIERMKDFHFSFLILEFDMNDVLKYPEGSRVPKNARSKVKVTGKYLLKCLMEFEIWYDTKIIFCGNKQNAFLVTNSIFKRLTELFDRGSDDKTASRGNFDF